ncbi:MAG: serine/threonine-protein kinase [Gammaproteobacteria bacterium]
MSEAIRSIRTHTCYHLKRKIASGGMGTVYEAEQYGAEGFVKTLALKTLLPQLSRTPIFVELFIEEAKLVADLVHPNIVQIYQFDRYDDGYFIAMEYIEGVTVADFIQRHRELDRPIPADLASFIVSRVCRGLEYAHNKRDRNGKLLGIVHRDVCPNNVMINREGEVKLTDFGVAKVKNYMGSLEGSYLVGKKAYRSPEQAAAHRTDERSDLYSLGLVYFELLTKTNRFEASCHGLELDPLSYRPDIPPEMLDILNKSLAPYPADRYASASEMCTALEMLMYSKGYGPTIVKLARYLNELYAGRLPYRPVNTHQLETTVLIGDPR